MVHNDSESLGNYAKLGRQLGNAERARVRDVFKRILDEMDDSHTSGSMFEPYAKVVNFVLANRKIAQQVAEVLQEQPSIG
jgi:hypothetical protein